jgi:hypothetical protein
MDMSSKESQVLAVLRWVNTFLRSADSIDNVSKCNEITPRVEQCRVNGHTP